MKYNPDLHHRRSIRLHGYDYRHPGAYFVTLCTHERACLFGEVVDGDMRLNEFGRIVEFTWRDLVNHVAGIILDRFVIMPNHVHGIVIITNDAIVGAGSEPAPTATGPAPTATGPAPTVVNHKKCHALPEIVRQFKTFSARRINKHRGIPGAPVWQRNYYEHIIRSEDSLHRIRAYIANNPLQWALDRENPANLKHGVT